MDQRKKIIMTSSLIIILILLIFMFYVQITKISSNYVGERNYSVNQVSVFSIDPEYDCDNTCIQEIIDQAKETASKEVFEEIEIKDDEISFGESGIRWNNRAGLNIFQNKQFQNTNKIAPGVSGEYQFIINNNYSSSIVYNLNFSEANPSNINMKYRLKRNNQYVNGDAWVNPDQLEETNLLLNTKTQHMYVLEWKWEDHTNDTEVGIIQDQYKINIQIRARGIVN